MDASPLVSPPTPAFRDRHTGLIIFGILEIMLGGFGLLMIPLSVFGQVMAAKKNGTDLDFALVAPTLLTFSILGVGLIWLGIGSMQARRWARALLLCFGWMGLCCGVIALAVVVPALGSMEATMRQQGQEMPPAAVAIAKFVAVAMITVIYVIIPGSLVLFYRSMNVKLTCEQRDPVERWTDRCPLPVLAICIIQVYGGIYMLVMPRFGAAFPLAGYLMTGWAARIAWLGFAGFSLYAARGFYRLQPHAWLVYTIVMAAIGLSSFVTFLRVDLLEYYRAVGIPEAQLKQIAASPFLQGHMFTWITALSFVLMGGYLLYLRRFFVGAKLPSGPA